MAWRYKLILFLFIFIFLLIEARLFYWQIVKAENLSAIGQNQYDSELKIIPGRGSIKTSDGFSIVTNKISYLLYANPKQIKDREKVSDLLAPLIDMDSSTISAALKRDSFWSPLKSGIDEDIKKKIDKLKIVGLGFEDQPTRLYPEASMAAQLLGFVGKDQNGDPQGYFGLEGFYNRQLKGKAGLTMHMRDAWGNPIISKTNYDTGKVDGRTLHLHLDRVDQYILEQELKKGITRYGATSGMGGIIDPKTGGILAMASFPTYSPNNYQVFSEDLYKNPFISFNYEPGSTFKPIIMSSALDLGVIRPNTQCTICSGPITIGEYTIRTWNDKYHPNSTMIDVIQHSDNTGMVYVGRRLGLDNIYSYLQKFGFGEYTGIDLQGEELSSLRPKSNWYPIDLATSTFGQGIIVTPIQLLSAFASIANDGKRMEPHIVKAIETPDGEYIEIPPKVINQPVSSKTAKVMTEILVNAVENGESKWINSKGYRIAGKTGTAQIAIQGHYDPNKTITSFIGFAPADDPKFVMLIVLNRPSTSIYGSETAAPIFFNVANKLLTYYNIPPSKTIITTPEPVKEVNIDAIDKETDELLLDLSTTPSATESSDL